VAKREINNLNKFIASRMRVVNDITERGLVSLDKYKKLPFYVVATPMPTTKSPKNLCTFTY